MIARRTLELDALVLEEQPLADAPAEALRRTMLEFIDSPKNVDDAYPGVWAPFMVVGLTQRAVN